MTLLVQEMLHQIEQLPPEEQDRLAEWVLAEIASEQRWTALFNQSQTLLEQMAQQALQEDAQGATKPFGG